jgi:hypothetical protein
LNTPFDKRRPIDKLRDGAASFEIRTPGDDSAILEMISTGDRLLVVKGKGIYEVKLADEVDPKRKNINAPNTIQKVLPYGADDAWVGAVLLTGHHLLLSSCSPSNVDGNSAFGLMLKIVEDISGAYQLLGKYHEAEGAARKSLDPKIQKDRSVVVPAIGNVESRCNEFLQRSDHAFRELFRLVQMFYSDVGSGGWEGLKKKIDGGSRDIDNFPQFLAETVPFLQLIRNARNCVEHPRPDQRLVVADFSLDPMNVVLPPIVEIIHPRTPLSRVPMSTFFTQTLQQIVRVVELMVVFLCNRHVMSPGGFPVQVIEFAPEHRKSAHVRYGYGTVIGDQIVPMS